MKLIAACATAAMPRQTGQAPELAGSEWVAKDITSLARIPLPVSTAQFRSKAVIGTCPCADGASLSIVDLSAVLTYIRESWATKTARFPLTK